MNNTTREVAAFIVETPSDCVPARDRKAAARACWDTSGVLLAGSVQPVGRLILGHVAQRGGNPEATVLGTAVRTSAVLAALANGTFAHALDYDDMGAYGHPSGCLLTSLLAAAEQAKRPVSGYELLTAYCIGFEVGAGLKNASGYDQAERGFHSTAVFGGLAAAAACSRLLHLSVDQTMAALGIAASETGGLIANFGTMTKPLHMGLAARNGTRAALLARAGFTAAQDIIEARQGFAETFFGLGTYDLSTMVPRLGNPFRVADSITLKKYPCCGSNHSALDSVLGVMAERGIKYENVERVDVHEVLDSTPVVRYPLPETGLQGKFSLRYAVATAIWKQSVTIEDFTDERVKSSEMRDAMQKVRVHIVPRWHPASMYGAGAANPVEIRLRDGKVISAATDRSEMLGTPVNPLSDSALAAKVRTSVSCWSYDETTVKYVTDAWSRLDVCDDIAALVGQTVREKEAVLKGEGSEGRLPSLDGEP